MSMQTNMIYGYGFEVCYVDDEKLIEFIKNHKETFCKSDEEKELFEELLKYEPDDYCLDDLLEESDVTCDVTGRTGFGVPISNIISRETGIRVQYEIGCGDCGSVPSVLFSEQYPWNYNEKEKNLTVDSLNELFIPYVKELGLSKEVLGGLAVEYYG